MTVLPVEVDGEIRAKLAVGEIKTYPDRGGETNRGQLAQARAQLGLYLHALEVIVAGFDDPGRPILDEEGFLVLTRPGTDFPRVRTGEKLRYQADRARRGFDQLEAAAMSLKGDTEDAIDAVLHADTHYSEACLEFCDLAERCHAMALAKGDPAILGEAMRQFLGHIDLRRAVELLEGAPPANAREADMMERLKAAEEPGWE